MFHHGTHPQGRFSIPANRRPVGGPRLPAAILLASALAACGGGGGGPSLVDQLPSQIGAPNTKPGEAGLFDGAQYLVDQHSGGAAGAVRVLNLSWGRLVDIYDTPGAGDDPRLVYPDIVIGEDVRTELGKWTLTTNAVTGRAALVIQRVNTVDGNDEFDQLVLDAQVNLGPVLPKGVGLTEAPPFSFIARNSVLVVQFDDLIDPDTIALNDSVKIGIGNPPNTPFDARLLLDRNHGGISPLDGAFHSTRLLIDMTISESEQLNLAAPLALNGAGLPASVESQKANVALRIPTRVDSSVGQFEILRNLSGRGLATTNNGPVDLGVSTQDVVRGMRSGNPSDQNNGFMTDQEGPRMIGRQAVQVSSAVNDPSGKQGYDFVVGFTFLNPTCALNPAVGDVLQVGTNKQLEVTQQGAVSQSSVAGLRVRLPLEADPAVPEEILGSGLLITPWRTNLTSIQAPCFFRLSPTPGVLPNLEVQPAVQVVVEFSEPIDAASVRPFDSFFVRNKPSSTSLRDFVVGDVFSTAGLTEFRFTPLLPLNHQLGTAETYFVDLISALVDDKVVGISDLAGNRVQALPPQVSFSVAPTAPNSRSGGLVLRFNNVSEDEFPGADLRGQFLYNLAAGEIRPRPFTRFSLLCDRTIPIVSQMQTIATGLQTPLSNLGSKLHILWRYCDLGLPQVMTQEDSFPNLDVEGISLSPLGGQVTSTFYPQFQMSVGHSDRLPDEALDPNLLPLYEISGFGASATFAENYLDDPLSGPFVVHPRELGFLVSSTEVFIAETGSPMVHFPWNRTVAPEDKTYFTWRDTAVQTWGGRNPAGTGLAQPGVPVTVDVGLSGAGAAGDQYGGATALNKIMPAGIPTVGLPLLMEFRCYPGESLSVNNFDVSIAITSSPRPFFRAFSTGGFNQQGAPVIKDPDAQTSPTGGFNGNPQLGAIGSTTAGRDPTVYMGQLELITRVSRVHTVLFNSLQANPDYAGVVLEPRAVLQPFGTQVVLAFRGDDTVSLPPTSPYFDTALMDVYGEPLAATDALVLDNPTWSENINSNDGQRYVQLRITFVSNPLTELSPTLSGVGVAWRF